MFRIPLTIELASHSEQHISYETEFKCSLIFPENHAQWPVNISGSLRLSMIIMNVT